MPHMVGARTLLGCLLAAAACLPGALALTVGHPDSPPPAPADHVAPDAVAGAAPSDKSKPLLVGNSVGTFRSIKWLTRQLSDFKVGVSFSFDGGDPGIHVEADCQNSRVEMTAAGFQLTSIHIADFKALHETVRSTPSVVPLEKQGACDVTRISRRIVKFFSMAPGQMPIPDITDTSVNCAPYKDPENVFWDDRQGEHEETIFVGSHLGNHTCMGNCGPGCFDMEDRHDFLRFTRDCLVIDVCDYYNGEREDPHHIPFRDPDCKDEWLHALDDIALGDPCDVKVEPGMIG
mmetsp:Transcript_36117/g.103202  ORF Transcript_36117/g.103202 Transcript_36117/m.103202 type:complete len:290 (-) Transcript_36117:57-926(-)